MHNLTETEEWATVQAIQDGDALSNANLEPTAQKLLNRTAYLHGAHRIQQLQLATGGTADSTNQNIAGGATYTALTGCSATLTNAKAGDAILVAAQLGFCDNAGLGNIAQLRAKLQAAGSDIAGAEAGISALRGSVGQPGDELTILGGYTLGADAASIAITAGVKVTDGAAAGADWRGRWTLIALLLRPTP